MSGRARDDAVREDVIESQRAERRVQDLMAQLAAAAAEIKAERTHPMKPHTDVPEYETVKMAHVSPCRTYRYTLGRRWGWGPSVLWVMLNPSTADHTIDDPTIRRCIGFTKAWGYRSLTVVNLFALRATDPKALVSHPNPVGPDNWHHVEQAIADAPLIVAAWGAFSRVRSPIETLVRSVETPLRCLGTTKAGAPRHPLYVRGDQPHVPLRSALSRDVQQRETAGVVPSSTEGERP